MVTYSQIGKAMSRVFGRRATNYLFFEMWPSLILGVLIFVFVLLMAQALRLTELVLEHGVSLANVGEIMGYLTISFLPVILPMSLLFAVLLTYGRLSQDSEIVAFKAVGYSQAALTLPALLLSLLIAFVSAQTFFSIAPWGNRQFEILIGKLSSQKAGATLKEGTFSEGFYDLVVYANKVDSKTGHIEKVFIYDERSADLPLTIIAKEGQIIQNTDPRGNSVLLQLKDGNIHRKGEAHTKVNFGTFEVRLTDPVQQQTRAKTPPSLTMDEIREKLNDPFVVDEQRRTIETEYNKRMAIPMACVIFGLLGVGLGTQTNRRQQKSTGFIVSLGVMILYWILYITCEGMARSGQLPVALAIWLPNILFSLFAVKRLRDIWN